MRNTQEKNSKEWLLNQIRLKESNSSGANLNSATEATLIQVRDSIDNLALDVDTLNINTDSINMNTDTLEGLVTNLTNITLEIRNKEAQENSKLIELNKQINYSLDLILEQLKINGEYLETIIKNTQ